METPNSINDSVGVDFSLSVILVRMVSEEELHQDSMSHLLVPCQVRNHQASPFSSASNSTTQLGRFPFDADLGEDCPVLGLDRVDQASGRTLERVGELPDESRAGQRTLRLHGVILCLRHALPTCGVLQ
jgi:hypothetical protein